MPGIQDHLREIQNIGRKTREKIINQEQCPSFAEHGIGLAGISQASAEFRFVRHVPAAPQLLIGLSGRGRVLVDNEWRTCRAGDAYLTPAACLHAYEAVDRWQVAWISFARVGAWALPDRPELRKVDPTPFAHVLSGLHDEAVGARRGVFLELWADLLRHHAMATLQTPSSRLWALWQRVQRNLDGDWTLSRLAQAAGQGEENLRLICRKELGRSPMSHVTYLRMQYARSLLAMGQKVDYVARRVGYENPYAFSTAFRRVIGHPPSHSRPG